MARVKNYWEIVGYLNRFDEYCSDLLMIKPTEAGGLVPFELNAAQKYFLDIIVKAVEEERKPRFIVLKSRKLGFSTFIQAFIYRLVTYLKYFEAATITHEAPATQNLHRMLQRYYNYFQDERKPARKSVGNQKRLEFSEIGSSVDLFTAGTDDSSRSFTPQAIHASEVAFWKNAEVVMTALMNAMPDDAWIFIETTANGMGNWFYETWQSAVEGKSDFIPVFCGWNMNPQCAQAKRPHEADMKYTAEEENLAIKYRLSENQIRWRRWAIINKCGDNLDTFHQEYPICPEEAFIGSGNPYFDTEKVTRIINYRRANPYPFRTGVLQRSLDNKTVKFIEDGSIKADGFPNGLCLYEEPDRLTQVKNNIIIAHDPAGGVYTNTEGSSKKRRGDTDFSVTGVLNRQLNRQVAWSRNKLNYDQQAELLLNLIIYYSGTYQTNQIPFVIIERTGAGVAVITALISLMRQLSIPLTRLYRKTLAMGIITEEQSENQIGFMTQEDNKHVVCGLLQQRIRESVDAYEHVDDITTIPCLYGLEECLTFVNNGGKIRAQSGYWDDYVMMTSLLLEANRVLEPPESLATEYYGTRLARNIKNRFYKKQGIW